LSSVNRKLPACFLTPQTATLRCGPWPRSPSAPAQFLADRGETQAREVGVLSETEQTEAARMESPSRRNPERRLLEAARYVVIPPGEASASAGPPHPRYCPRKARHYGGHRRAAGAILWHFAGVLDERAKLLRRTQTELAPELNRIVPRQVA